MKMPDLPKQNKQHEANFGIVFREWISNNPQITGSYELKDTKGENYLNFSEISEDQITYALLINSRKGVLMRVAGLKGEPDYIYMCQEPAYIVIKYPSSFSIITIGTFLMEKERSKRKSLTESQAEAISTITVQL